MNLDTNGYMYFGYTCLSIEQVNNNNGNTVSNNKIIYIKFQWTLESLESKLLLE